MACSKPLAPGTVVKFRGNPLGYVNRYAIVVAHDPYSGTLTLQTEGSDHAWAARHEVSVVRDSPATPLRYLRHKMPYGKWTCQDGREVLFNRDYKPIWERQPGQTTQRADSNEWVDFERQEWFYSDGHQPWRDIRTDRACNHILAGWGIPPV